MERGGFSHQGRTASKLELEVATQAPGGARARRFSFLPPYSTTSPPRRINDTSSMPRFDVVFVGHYERDGRGDLLKYLWDNGIGVRVFGTRWEFLGKRYRELNEGAV